MKEESSHPEVILLTIDTDQTCKYEYSEGEENSETKTSNEETFTDNDENNELCMSSPLMKVYYIFPSHKEIFF
jgi:hypothetical protein